MDALGLMSVLSHVEEPHNHNFITKNDILKKMLKSLLYGKINIHANNQKALFISKFLDIVKKYN